MKLWTFFRSTVFPGMFSFIIISWIVKQHSVHFAAIRWSTMWPQRGVISYRYAKEAITNSLAFRHPQWYCGCQPHSLAIIFISRHGRWQLVHQTVNTKIILKVSKQFHNKTSLDTQFFKILRFDQTVGYILTKTSWGCISFSAYDTHTGILLLSVA